MSLLQKYHKQSHICSHERITQSIVMTFSGPFCRRLFATCYAWPPPLLSWGMSQIHSSSPVVFLYLYLIVINKLIARRSLRLWHPPPPCFSPRASLLSPPHPSSISPTPQNKKRVDLIQTGSAIWRSLMEEKSVRFLSGKSVIFARLPT